MITLLIFATKIKNRFTKIFTVRRILLGGIITGIVIVSGILFISGTPDSALEMSKPILDSTENEVGTKIALSESMSMGNP